ncbi:MAG: TPM domain-containing protein [Bacteroidia bacterium]|nr:TPM domain-containing protein [Bacteroidia bacterium]
MTFPTATINRLLCLIFSLAAGIAQAQQYPRPAGFVTDTQQLLTAGERQTLDAYLTRFAQETSNEIAVAVLTLPEGEDLETYTGNLARSWQIGGAENNGVLLAVYPAQRKMRIEVGYGLEGAIPDATAFAITDGVLRPAFRAGQYYAGIDSAVRVLAGLARGEYQAQQLDRMYYTAPGASGPRSGEMIGIALAAVFLLLLFMFMLSFRRRQPRRGGGYTRRGWHDDGPAPPFIGGYWGGWGSGSDSGSSWGGGDSGSSWGGGGDFGGFSGGDFGGGGASGDW